MKTSKVILALTALVLAAAMLLSACGPPCPLPAKDSPSPILGKGEILAYLQQVE